MTLEKRSPLRDRSEILPLAALLLLAAVPFWRFFLQGRAFLPTDILFELPPWDAQAAHIDVHNPLISDPIRVYYPWLDFARTVVRDGSLPLWNPFIFSGVPHLANSLTATLYPLAAFIYILPVWVAYSLQGFLHVFLAGLFMYLYLRKLGIGRDGALLGGFAFMFNGFFVGWLQFGVFLYVAIWIPLVFLLMEYSWERQTAAWAMLCSLTLALSIYGGHAQVAYYLLMAAGAYWLFRAGVDLAASRNAGRRWLLRFSYLTGVVWIGAVLLSAAQTIPTLELAGLSGREGEDIDALLTSGIPRFHFITMLMPDALGNPVDGIWWGKHNYSETSMYVGVWPLLLAVSAIALSRNKYVWFFFGLLVFAALMATAFRPVAWPVLQLLPALDRFRGPGRIIFLADIALPVLAAYGFDAILRPSAGQDALAKLIRFAYPAAVIVAVAAVLAYVFTHLPVPFYSDVIKPTAGQVFPEGMTYGDLLLYEWDQFARFTLIFLVGVAALALAHHKLIAAGLAGILLLFITGADVSYNAAKYVTMTDPELLNARPALVSHLQEDDDLFRIVRFEGGWPWFTANMPSTYGVYDTQGSSSYVPKSYLEFLSLTRDQPPEANDAENIYDLELLKSKLVSMSNVKYIISAVEIDDPQFTFVAKESVLSLYENRAWFPRVFIVQDSEVLPREDVQDRMKDPGFDPSRVVLLEKENPPSGQEAASADASAVIMEYNANSLVVSATLPRDGYLVLSDAYYPGWKSYVDSNEAEVLRANYSFRAVHLQPGSHIVELRFEPWSVQLGLWISGLTALVFGTFLTLKGIRQLLIHARPRRRAH
jgi:hypothetical protein